jgi:hypothetical protein
MPEVDQITDKLPTISYSKRDGKWNRTESNGAGETLGDSPPALQENPAPPTQDAVAPGDDGHADHGEDTA